MAYDNTAAPEAATTPTTLLAVTEGGSVSKSNLHPLTKAEAIVEFMKTPLKDIIPALDWKETPEEVLYCEEVPDLALEEVIEAWIDYIKGPGDPLFKFQYLIDNLQEVVSVLELVEKYFRAFLQQHHLSDAA